MNSASSSPSWAELYLTIYSNMPKFYELLIDGHTERAFEHLRRAEIAMLQLTQLARRRGIEVGGERKLMSGL